MSWWRKLFFPRPSYSFKKVDWSEVSSRWQAVQALLQSKAQGDSKQAIIQADILIDYIMKSASVPGKTFGERLKSLKEVLPRPVYRHLWDAHLKRNELVHEQGSFVAEWERETHLRSFEEAIHTMRGMR